ncbi:MAG: PEGA domain-containing protein [Candidatus Krumholzibacteriia bacterium]
MDLTGLVLPERVEAVDPQEGARSAQFVIEPLERGRGAPGILIARVKGNPRDIRYFVNGVRIEPEEGIQWWRDARLEVELRPGFYSVEATYAVRAFAGESTEYRIATLKPVQVLSGLETYIVAEIRKDWRGIPEEEISHFRVDRREKADEELRDSRAVDEDTSERPTYSSASVPVRVDPTPSAEELAELEAAQPSDALVRRPGPDEIVVHGGGPEGEDQVIRIHRGTPAPVTGADDIVIRPSEVVEPDGPVDAGRADAVPEPAIHLEPSPPAVHIGLPPDAEPPHEELSVDDDVPQTPLVTDWGWAPSTLGGSRHAQITVVLHSQPSGAQVSIDDRPVGKTPLRVRIDPLSDHVLLFERDGCGDYVRLLSSAGWEKGRSPSIRVQLHCQ